MSCADGTCGTGDGNWPQPGDPDTTNIVLTATPAFGGIDVKWTYPGLNPQAVAHTILYRGIIPSFNGAIQHRIVTGDFFYDKVDTGLTYYYWIQIVSVNGTVGPLIGPASAQARPLIEDLIEQLTAQIDAGMLAQSLKAELDKISLLNANLLNEIMSRENGEISLAEAIAEAQAGTAQALTFISEHIASQTTTNSAIVEQINLVAATLDDDYAAITQAMQVQIDSTRNTVDALYTIKLTVNGLIGGFGVWNSGVQVQAGFDVDTFWVGRTGANMRKPFIISGDETFIDEAVINRLTFSKLRDEAGNFIVENGKVKATYLAVDYLSALSANVGQLTISGQNGDWGFIRSPGKWRDANWGFILAQHPAGDMFVDFTIGNCGMFMHHIPNVAGAFQLWGPGFNLDNGGLTISQANVINTLQLAGNAVTVPAYAESGGFGTVNLALNTTYLNAITGVTIDTGSSPVLVTFDADLWFSEQQEEGTSISFEIHLYRNGAAIVIRPLTVPKSPGTKISQTFWVGGTGGAASYQIVYKAVNAVAQIAEMHSGTATMFAMGVKR